MTIKCFVLTPLLTSLCFSSIAIGNEPDELISLYGDEEFISIATGISQPISKAPAVASVITSIDIKKMGATDVDDVLESIPGLHVSKNSVGYAPIYIFRGIHTETNPQVLMLVDGVPITSLYLGDRNQVWAGLSLESISRVEVIRGPGSAIYGADAFAGVINIVTKNAAELDGLKTGMRYGNFNTKDWWLTYGKASDDLSVSASFEIHETNGQKEKISTDAQTFLDAISGTSVSLAPGSINLNRKNIDARIKLNKGYLSVSSDLQTREDAGLGVGLAQALDPNGQASSIRFGTNLTYDNPNFSENLGIKAWTSYRQTTQEVDNDLVLFPPGSKGPFFDPLGSPLFPPFPNGIIGNPEVFERHSRANLLTTYRGFNNHEVLIGTGYYYGEVYKTEEEKNFGFDPTTGFPIFPGSGLVDVTDTPLVFLPEDNRENRYIFVQDVWHFANDWELTAGLRYDHYSDFGDTVNPRLALVWSTWHNLTTKFLYGEAFRAPSFAETRVQSNPTVLGNPSLQPETLKSYEIAFNYRPLYNVNLDLNLFHYQWKDIIQFVPDIGGTTRTAQNTGKQEGDGAELELSWDITEQISVLANYSWQESEDRNISADAANAPEQQFYARTNIVLPSDVDLTVQVNRVMDRNREFSDRRQNIADYTTVDFTLRKQFIAEKLELSLLAKNIFNEDAREPSLNGQPVPFIPDDLPLAGRQLLGEIRYHFN